MERKLKQALEMVLITEVATDNIRERMNDTNGIGVEIPRRIFETADELVNQFLQGLEEENKKDKRERE